VQSPVSKIESSGESDARRRLWARLIRTSCSTVAEEPEWMIEAILVVQPLDAPHMWQRDELLVTAEHIAAEYGIEATPEPDSDGLTIRFARAGQAAGEATSRFYVMPSDRLSAPLRGGKSEA
jgi:hypothetical protein